MRSTYSLAPKLTAGITNLRTQFTSGAIFLSLIIRRAARVLIWHLLSVYIAKTMFSGAAKKVSINTSQGSATWNQQQGCPQSSCPRPAFWNLVADEVLRQDWPQGVHLQAFADDFVFLINAGSKQEVKNLANKALQTFKTWTDKHKLEISLDKTNYLHMNKNRSGPIWYSGIKWGQNIIKRELVLKYLGVLIDDKFNFAAHLSAIKNKFFILRQGLRNVARTSWGLSKNSRRHLYLTRSWKSSFSMPQQHGPTTSLPDNRNSCLLSKESFCLISQGRTTPPQRRLCRS
ncbi:hypothetical protein AVEN_164494-1 [Araneus ventricosus]|uniref:Reverse transcriptase domain-containing protein n=1 Tax=Araneus ventricosus TaxID=182803 RepID=A0A4Y2QIS7_ARAVE|nr:hypothetical protein AVEN_164494-1 [Araneus ventricosus]